MIRSDLPQWAAALPAEPLDLLVIGGGATGLGVAVQAALEGRRVALLEGRDFAAGTSSRSTKLLHGGVRYLAQGQLGLVRQALRERAVILGLAPHLTQRLSFVVAETNWLSWAVTATGLKLYQWLAGPLSLGRTQAIRREALRILLPGVRGAVAGMRYWDAQFDDARLALALAQTARAAGAWLRNHTRVDALATGAQGWAIDLTDTLTGARAQLKARCVVNATGVWVDALRQSALAMAASAPLVRPSQGVHLVVGRETLPLSEAVLVPRTRDGRVLFAIPWMGATLIGTTDTARDDAPAEPQATQQELEFLFEETHRALGVRLEPAQVQSVWVGLRPLVQSAGSQSGPTAKLSREHLITREASGFISVTGGKWTTYRIMSQEVMAALVRVGDLAPARLVAHTEKHRLWGAPVADPCTGRLHEPPGLHLLGSAAEQAASLPGHEAELGLGLRESVVRYCARHEWAVTVEDLLARRWRALFIDARAAARMAPRVAQLLQEETGQDARLEEFLRLCQRYRLDSPKACSLSGP